MRDTRNAKQPGDVLVQVKLSAEMVYRLDMLTARERKARNDRRFSKSEIVREAVTEYLARVEAE